MTVAFCQTSNSAVCVIETVFSFVPLIAFLILGFYSYSEIRSISAYSRESFTWRHLTKLGFSGLQSVISFIFLLIYLLKETDVSLKTVIAAAISAFLWIFNSVLMRKEFEKLGYTSKHLKIAWGIMAVCEAVVLILGAVGLNTDDFSYIAPIYGVSEFCLIVLFVLGNVYSDDYAFYPNPNNKADLYSSIASDVGLEVDEKDYDELMPHAHKPQPVEERKEEDSFRPFNDRNYDGRQERYRGLSASVPDSRPSSGHWRASNTSIQINLRDEIQNIDTISVVNFEDTMRFDKQTILYIIEYYIKGHRFITKRSYSEFLYMYKEIKQDQIAIELPEMPPKKPLLGKTEEVIAERREAFDKLLKLLVAEKVALNYLREFLQTPNNLPYYGKISKKDSGKLVPPNNSVYSERDGSGTIGRITNGSTTRPLNKSTISIVHPPRDIRDSRDSTGSMKQSGRRAGSRVNHYTIETEKLFRGSDGSIYYTLRLRETGSGAELSIVKRYREFKAFHEQFKKSVEKKLKDQIPDLPHKGKAGAFTSPDDPKVTDFRKAELPNYLQLILNNPEFNGNKVIHEFLSSGVQEDT